MIQGNASPWGRFCLEQTRKPRSASSRIVWSMYWLVYSSLLRTAASYAIPRSWESTASRLRRRAVALASLSVQNQLGWRAARRSVHEKSSPSTDPSQAAP